MLTVGAAGEEVLLGLHFSMGTVQAVLSLRCGEVTAQYMLRHLGCVVEFSGSEKIIFHSLSAFIFQT